MSRVELVEQHPGAVISHTAAKISSTGRIQLFQQMQPHLQQCEEDGCQGLHITFL